jgi:hypothetical protein
VSALEDRIMDHLSMWPNMATTDAAAKFGCSPATVRYCKRLLRAQGGIDIPRGPRGKRPEHQLTHTIAWRAHRAGRSAARELARELHIDPRTATTRIVRARQAGYDMPWQKGMRFVDQPIVEAPAPLHRLAVMCMDCSYKITFDTSVLADLEAHVRTAHGRPLARDERIPKKIPR